MGTQVRDLFNDNLLNADMYMGVIKATIFSCVFCLVIIISGKCKKDLCNGSLELIGKMLIHTKLKTMKNNYLI